MLKKIIPFILIFCLLFATTVMAEDVPPTRGNRPQGGPPQGFNPGSGEFTPPEDFTPGEGEFTPPEGFDPSQMPDFGNGTPPEGFNPENREFTPPENIEVQGDENTEPQGETSVENPQDNTNPQGNGQFGGGRPNGQGNWNNMFGQQQTVQEQPTGFKLLVQQYFTPAVSVLLLILAFVFVIFYKRKQY